MQGWINKIAVITDCADEVGFNVMKQLAKSGMIVIGFNKKEEIIAEVTEKLKLFIATNIPGKIELCKCNITDIMELEAVFEKIKDTYGGVDVLINNAFYNVDCLVNTGELQEFRDIIDVNIYALVACTRLSSVSMIERKTRGHIVNINDLCSYQIPNESRKTVFIAAKAAITSINEILRHEFRYLNANIKVTNIACGSIECSIESVSNEPKLRIEDIAKLVKIILNTPEQLQVHEVLLDSVVE